MRSKPNSIRDQPFDFSRTLPLKYKSKILSWYLWQENFWEFLRNLNSKFNFVFFSNEFLEKSVSLMADYWTVMQYVHCTVQCTPKLYSTVKYSRVNEDSIWIKELHWKSTNTKKVGLQFFFLNESLVLITRVLNRLFFFQINESFVLEQF